MRKEKKLSLRKRVVDKPEAIIGLFSCMIGAVISGYAVVSIAVFALNDMDIDWFSDVALLGCGLGMLSVSRLWSNLP